MSQWQPHIRNSRHHKDNIKDCERYEQHIKDIERAIEILEGEEPRMIKELMLKQLGCDRETYGDIQIGTKTDRIIRADSDGKLIWSLVSDLKSFRHALRIINND